MASEAVRNSDRPAESRAPAIPERRLRGGGRSRLPAGVARRGALLLALAALAAALGPPRQAAAQVVTSEIVGTVTDTDGRPLAGVQVSVTDLRTNFVSGSLTNESGHYFVPHLQPGGPFLVRAQIIGYRPEARGDVSVSLGRAATVNFRLEQTAVAVEALTVRVERDETGVFSRSRTGQATTLGAVEVETFPTIERNLMELALLSPYANQFENAPSIGGKNNRFNNIQIDGAVNNDVFGVGESGTPGGQANAKAITLEAIQELQVLVAPFDVRHSNFTGGLINAVTKAGTNEWQFSAFGFRTDENFVSKLGGAEFGDFNDTKFGGTLGGPLQQDKVFFFGAFEGQLRDSPFEGFAPGAACDELCQQLGADPVEAQRLIDIFRDQYGVDVGTTGAGTIDNPRTNVFGRLDFNLSESNRLVLRHNYSRGANDLLCFRSSGSYCLTSNLAPFVSNAHSSVAQLFSRLGGRWDNEAILTAEFIRDQRDPALEIPQIDVGTSGPTFVVGAERFSQANRLNQDIVQFTNNLTGRFGNHRILFGTHNEYYNFFNLFEPGILGLWSFASLDDLEAGTANNFVRRIPVAGVSEDELPAQFNVFQLGFYAQDEWTASPELTLTFGLRAEIPILPDAPRDNPLFEQVFGRSTATVPSGKVLWQPRFGFNWRKEGEYLTQLRGGAGLFAGRTPYVWISNAYGNTGLQSVDLVCRPPNVPAFDINARPSTCADGSGAAEAQQRVNVVDENFKFPLDLKLSAGIDRELPSGFSVTAELLYSKALEEAFFEELNLVAPTGMDPVDGRATFGVPTAAGCGNRGGCFTNNRIDERFAQVVGLTNRSDSEALLLVFELQRRFSDWLRFRGSYTYADVRDLQVQQSSQASSNIGRNPIAGDLNNPPLTASSYEVENKVVLAATGRWELGRGFLLEVTPQYFAQSGLPYSYAARGDLNGDGYRDPVISRDNDLIYIPNDVNELAWSSAADAAAFDALIQANECLRSQRGSIMRRNSCRNPWNRRFDLRLVLGFPGGPDGRFQLVADFINLFANRIELSQSDRGIEALQVLSRENGDPNGRFVFRYTGPRADDQGRIVPFRPEDPGSRRQLQIGLRYNFR